MTSKYYCPFITRFESRTNSIGETEFIDNNCMEIECMFWDGNADDSKPKGKCILVRAAYALSTQEA